MSGDSDPSDELIRSVWSTEDAQGSAVDEDCNPNRVCRNARAFDFEGFAENGGDVQKAWRETLARGGKLDGSAESIRDLVLGRPVTS